ncbi:MAG: hypothetical protein HYZ28_20705 [Myxococcales bacterium]|nr:hypothetical protein [Myxococcales bacterium]
MKTLISLEAAPVKAGAAGARGAEAAVAIGGATQEADCRCSFFDLLRDGFLIGAQA